MAAAVANRPRNHAHQPDAAAAVDQADAPPHLRDATREKGTRTTLTYQRTKKKIQGNNGAGKASRRARRCRRPGAPAERGGELSSFLAAMHARTHSPARGRARARRPRTPSGARCCCRRRRRSCGTCSARRPLRRPCRPATQLASRAAPGRNSLSSWAPAGARSLARWCRVWLRVRYPQRPSLSGRAPK